MIETMRAMLEDYEDLFKDYKELLEDHEEALKEIDFLRCQVQELHLQLTYNLRRRK